MESKKTSGGKKNEVLPSNVSIKAPEIGIKNMMDVPVSILLSAE